jgi:hypothetical protein
MSIDSNIATELKICKELRDRYKPLYDRMDLTFKHFRGDKFTIPESEGTFENVTTNRAPAEGWKIINFLASAQRKLSEVMIATDKSKDREELSYNELLVNGLLYSADRKLDSDPLSPSIHALKVFYRVVRGWCSDRLLVCEDDEDNIYLDLLIMDPRNSTFLGGNKRLLKFYYDRYADVRQLKEEYPGWNGKADDKTNLVKITDIWDCSENGKSAQEAVTDGTDYLKEPEVVKIGGQTIDYLPIRVKAGGTVPLINDDDIKNDEANIAHVGEDYQANYRELLDVASRLMSYNLTRSGMEAKMPQIIYRDSTKDNGEAPQFPKDAYQKSKLIILDRGKGQELAPPIQMTQGDKINLMLSQVANMLDDGGLSRIFSGETSVAMTAFGMNLMNQNTSRQIWPFKLALEQDYIWMAGEMCSQYKKGSYKKAKFEGYNSKQARFSTEIKPAEIKEGRAFECSLLVEELSDRAAHIETASREIAAGLNSRRGAIDVNKLSQDPDATLKSIAEEKARELFNIGPLEALIALIEDYIKEPDAGKKLIIEEAAKAINQIKTPIPQPESQQMPGQETTGPGRIMPANRPMNSRTPQSNIPASVRQAVINAGGQGNG